VIFSTDGISYSEILSVIARSNDRSVNYRLVPNSLEAIIGKTRIDNLDAIPLVEIEYNLHRPANRALKRGTDILVSSLVLILAFPFVWLRSKAGRRSAKGSLADLILQVPSVLIGRLSLVGRPIDEAETTGRNNVSAATSGSFLGPRGLTGLVQLNSGHNLSGEDSDRFKLYYAKNHSLVLDVEILVKTLITLLKK
jgi:lipopolysaccharide/colanic/teichoic acid biosynthesis glycosyltransferase